MKFPHHLSWENFASSIFVKGQQRVHRVAASPLVEIFGDGVSNRVGVWLEAPANTPIPPEISKLSFIATRIFERDGRTLLEFAASTPALHRQFYHFATAVSERVLVEKTSAMDAAVLELQCFSELLKQGALLGIERQLGILGELVFLERLTRKIGVNALDAWIGPVGEPHDFRLRASEFEVKTTTNPQRIHTINGTEQLVATRGCDLYLISVQLAPAGAGSGFSLADKVDTLSKMFSVTPMRLKQFTAALERCGLVKADLAHYTRRFTLRRALGVIPVDKNFPAITRPVIQKVLGSRGARVESLQYEVNLEGLEDEDGTRRFEAIISE